MVAEAGVQEEIGTHAGHVVGREGMDRERVDALASGIAGREDQALQGMGWRGGQQKRGGQAGGNQEARCACQARPDGHPSPLCASDRARR